jgi:hypothetical protein
MLKLFIAAPLVFALLVVAPGGAVHASLPYAAGHVQLVLPDGWSIQPSAADEYGEADLQMLAQTEDEAQEIDVYQESLAGGERTALDYLKDAFRLAASEPGKHNFQVTAQPTSRLVPNAEGGAYGAYSYADNDGVAQIVLRLVAVLGTDVYELDVQPIVSYLARYQDEFDGELNCFQLIR